MAARAYYSDKQLLGKNSSEKQDMLMEKGVNWNDYPVFFKRGTYAKRVLVNRTLTKEELEQLPEHHNARKNPELVVTRSEIKKILMPVFSKVTNREDVIFEDAKPIIEEGETDGKV